MRDLAIFCGDTRDSSQKKEREAGILRMSAGAGSPIFIWLGCGNRKGKVAEYGN